MVNNNLMEMRHQQIIASINHSILQKIEEVQNLFLEVNFENMEAKEIVRELIHCKLVIQKLDIQLGLVDVNTINEANILLLSHTKALFESIWEMNINSFSDPQVLQSVAANSIDTHLQNPVNGQLSIFNLASQYTELTGVIIPLAEDS